MATYILLFKLTPEGRVKTLQDPDNVLREESSISIPDAHLLGLYGVLGDYDFVGILEAPNNESVARFSLELGVKVGAHITSMPAIPIGRLEGATRHDPLAVEAGVGLVPPDDIDLPQEPPTAGPRRY
jgi:uncharacterized protein with GYD domain